MALYESFIRETVSISEASKLAQAWRNAKPQTRRAAVKAVHDGFEIKVEGTRTTFCFFADGSVKTVNAPRISVRKFLVVDETKAVVGCCKGRPIYA